MLVLTRRLMERLYIGDEICVTIVRIEGGQVRLGIEAPRHVRVVRSELLPQSPSAESRRPETTHMAAPQAEPTAPRLRIESRATDTRLPLPSHR